MGIFERKGKVVAEIMDSGSNMVDSVSGGVTDIIAASKGELTPEAKYKLAELTMNLGYQVKELALKAQTATLDFFLEYEGAAKDLPKSIQIIRALIRPIITIYMFLTFAMFCTIDIYHVTVRTEDYTMILKSLPSEYWIVFGIVLTFWFGGKVGERITEKLKAKS